MNHVPVFAFSWTTHIPCLKCKSFPGHFVRLIAPIGHNVVQRSTHLTQPFSPIWDEFYFFRLILRLIRPETSIIKTRFGWHLPSISVSIDNFLLGNVQFAWNDARFRWQQWYIESDTEWSSSVCQCSIGLTSRRLALYRSLFPSTDIRFFTILSTRSFHFAWPSHNYEHRNICSSRVLFVFTRIFIYFLLTVYLFINTDWKKLIHENVSLDDRTATHA